MQHDAVWLRDYLVAGVEDPRLNIQSVLSRHFLTRSVFGEALQELMGHEYRFAAAMNWLRGLAGRGGGSEEREAVRYALRQGADNAEGLQIPWFVVETFGQLPLESEGLKVPNYLEEFLSTTVDAGNPGTVPDSLLNTFRDLWSGAFSRFLAGTPGGVENASATGPSSVVPQKRSVIEPACGSANDFRFFQAYGLTRWLDYCGMDLCAKNIDNAHALFPEVRFEVGNVFEIAAADKAFDLCIVHDLFEHLSMEGLQAAVAEVCRVTRLGICVGFFQMEEIGEHMVRPLNDYYCNLLSMARTKELFAAHGFKAQVIHIGTFLRDQLGWEETYNPSAYTFLLRAR